ncbi:site-2 protease family protein [Rhodocaloribacter litoris]|uniref:site-2 protease family protein n=1 Tax=Rhodocaloribacter litoris TaxID=2558931 RepID=UPI00141D821D|nr:site-2 protease family protein [Rhodocaloribacter litoris]QXD16741.1 site-2 protease family protein [Rhodocaloribacter litoris]
MKHSLKVGSVAGIGIYLHWTFLLLLAGIFAFFLLKGDRIEAALVGVGLILVVFACVVLHELGHALTARHFGVPTRDITLYPIGGVARLQRIPEAPMQEFWIAVAGPAVNVVIAVLLLGVKLATGGSLSPAAMTAPSGDVVGALLWINLLLVGFNLLPAFPMDGGRVLRALLATRMDYARATQIAAGIGQGMAILFGLVGLVGFNPILLFIALFVYIGAQQEAQQAMMRSLVQGIPVRQAMMTRFRTLTPDDPLRVAVEELLAGSDQDFPVVRNGHVCGMLTRKRLLRALAEHGPQTRVGDVVPESDFVLEDTCMLDEAFQRMQEQGVEAAPVVRAGRLVGLLTLENVGELMMIHAALQQPASRREALS